LHLKETDAQEVKLDGGAYLIMREEEMLAVMDGGRTTHKS